MRGGVRLGLAAQSRVEVLRVAGHSGIMIGKIRDALDAPRTG
jgi:hypothetical protein